MMFLAIGILVGLAVTCSGQVLGGVHPYGMMGGGMPYYGGHLGGMGSGYGGGYGSGYGSGYGNAGGTMGGAYLGNSLGSGYGGYGNNGHAGYGGGQRYAGHQQGLGSFAAGDAGAGYNSAQGGNQLMDRYIDTTARDGFSGTGFAGHNQGRKDSGFHRSYSNVESGRNVNFVDDSHDTGAKGYGQVYDDANIARLGNGYRGHNQGGMYGNQVNNHLLSNNGMAGGNLQGGSYGGSGAGGYYGNQGSHMANQNFGSNHLGYGHGLGYGQGYGHGMGYGGIITPYW